MTLGIGGSSVKKELDNMTSMVSSTVSILKSEYYERINKLTSIMKKNNIDAIYLDCSTNLSYFTSINLHPSERLHGAVVLCNGKIYYICPEFEKEKMIDLITIEGEIITWQEFQSPTKILINLLNDLIKPKSIIAIDEMTPLFIFDSISKLNNQFTLINAEEITKLCRITKSENEISIIQSAMNITLEVHKATARVLYEGMTTEEVQQFLVDAHLRLGADTAPVFKIVLFGEASAYPHGVSYSQSLKKGDMVLIDVGAGLAGYCSDITRSYVFGDTNHFQKQIWEIEKEAQMAVFEKANIGAECQMLDAAARHVITKNGLGPKYNTPGLPHRAGHGIGLDIHEHPYIVEGNRTKLSKGMCFSNEPSICIYGKFGVRLEDHIYMDENGANWFTQPSYSFEDPFGYKS